MQTQIGDLNIVLGCDDLRHGGFGDSAGQVTDIIHSHNQIDFANYRYTYDANGNRLSEIHEQGKATSYQYDAADRLITITEDDTTIQYTLDPVANRTEEQHTNNQQTIKHRTYQYNTRDQLTQLIDELEPQNSQS